MKYLSAIVHTENILESHREHIWKVIGNTRNFLDIFNLISGGTKEKSGNWSVDSQCIKNLLEELNIPFKWNEVTPLLRVLSNTWHSESLTFNDFILYFLPNFEKRVSISNKLG